MDLNVSIEEEAGMTSTSIYALTGSEDKRYRHQGQKKVPILPALLLNPIKCSRDNPSATALGFLPSHEVGGVDLNLILNNDIMLKIIRVIIVGDW